MAISDPQQQSNSIEDIVEELPAIFRTVSEYTQICALHSYEKRKKESEMSSLPQAVSTANDNTISWNEIITKGLYCLELISGSSGIYKPSSLTMETIASDLKCLK